MTDLSEGKGEYICILHVCKIPGNDSPLVDRSITIDMDKSVRYYIHNTSVNVSEHKCPSKLHDFQELPKLLRTFENVRVCTGL